jgi:hypothetical protein
LLNRLFLSGQKKDRQASPVGRSHGWLFLRPKSETRQKLFSGSSAGKSVRPSTSDIRAAAAARLFRAKLRLMRCSKSIVIRSLRRQGRAMPAMRRVVAVDQLLRNAPAALDASGTPDGFINLGGVISWIKSFSASASNGLRSILKFEGAAIAASL